MEEKTVQEIVAEVIKPIQIELDTTQLSAVQPPFFPNQFTKWRKKALIVLEQEYLHDATFAKRQACLSEFYARVNIELRTRFVEKLKRPYVAIIEVKEPDFGDGSESRPSIEKIRLSMGLGEQFELMTQRIAEWCIQMELAEDTKEIACEFMLLGEHSGRSATTAGDTQTEYSETFSNERLEGQLLELVRGRCKERLSFKMSSLVKGYVAEQVEGFSQVVTKQGWRSSNISYDTYMSLYLRIMGTGSLPLSMILPQYALLYVAAGAIGAALIRRVGHWIEGTSIESKLCKVTKGYWDSAIFLHDFNMRCQQAILRCLHASDQETLAEERRNLCRDFSRLIYEPDELNEILAQEETEREIHVEKRPDGVQLWTPVEKEPSTADAEASDNKKMNALKQNGKQSVAMKQTKPFKEVPVSTLPGWVEWQ